MQNFYNSNPYTMPQNNYMPNPSMTYPQSSMIIGDQLLKVNGIEGAKAFGTKPNSVVALFDANDDIMYIKTTDSANFPSIRKFRFTEIKEDEESSSKYVTIEEFNKFKQEVIDNGKQFIQQQRKYTNNAESKSKRTE